MIAVTLWFWGFPDQAAEETNEALTYRQTGRPKGKVVVSLR